MDLKVVAYLLYLLITVPITIWVGLTLSRNGKLFLIDVFDGNEGLAGAVNHLLVVGFYLLNLGFVALHLTNGHDISSGQLVVEQLSFKVGTALFVLGIVHLLNVLVFSRMRRRARSEHLRIPPVAPQAIYPPDPGTPAYAFPAPPAG